MTNRTREGAEKLTAVEQLVAVLWLPASQLGGVSNRAQYAALGLLITGIFYRAVLLPLGSPAAFAARRRPLIEKGSWMLGAWFLYVVFQIIFQFRGLGTFWGFKEVFLSLTWLLIVPVYFYVAFATLSLDQAGRMIRLVFYGLLIIVIMNLVGYFLSFQTEVSLDGFVGGDSRMLALIGIDTKRIIFPFGGGVNGYGIIVALAFVTSIFSIKAFNISSKLISFALACVCIFSLAAADSRAALGIALLIVFIWKTFPHFLNSRWLGFAVFIPILGPILLMNLAVAIPDWAVELISRSGTTGRIEDVLTTGRSVFWRAVLSDLTDHPSVFLVGYGPYSQIISEAGSILGRYLGRVGGDGQFTFHSTSAQIVMDLGIGGLVAHYWISFAALVSLSSINQMATQVRNTQLENAIRLTTLLMLALILSGVTESSTTFYLRDSLIIHLALISIGIFGKLLWHNEANNDQALS